MGREIRRVSLDFDHPLNKVWPGFLNPYWEMKLKCPHCKNGYSSDGERLNDLWYGHVPFKPEDNGSTPFTRDTSYVLALAKRNVRYEGSVAEQAHRLFEICLLIHKIVSLKEERGEVISYESSGLWQVREDVRFSGYWPGSEQKVLKRFFEIFKEGIPESWEDPRIMELAHQVVEPLLNRELDRLLGYYNSEWQHHLNQEEVDCLIEHNYLVDFTHTHIKGQGWVKKDPPYHPTATEVNEWSLGCLSHDSGSAWCVISHRAEKEGVFTGCEYCDGNGYTWPDKATEEAYEAWTETPPPEGPGYQFWENTSEGSPQSPVFETPEDLARYLTDKRERLGGGTTNYEGWLQWITSETPSMPTLIMVGGKPEEHLG